VASPASLPEAIGVGTTTTSDAIASFSLWGRSPFGEIKPDISAPGASVRSALPGGGYGIMSGTSMAAPHMSGAVALVLSANPRLIGKTDIIKNLFMMTAAPKSYATSCGNEGPGNVPNNAFGHGRIDAYAAVAQAHDPVPWLTVQPISGGVAAGAARVVTLTLDAAGLDVQNYTANLVITSNDPDSGRIVVPVSLNVTSSGPQIARVTISNLRDVNASVSWITTAETDGEARYGTSPEALTNVAYDDRGAGTRDDVHHVTLSGLSPLTTYYFFVRSDGVADINAGSYYSLTTGASLGVPASDSVYGRVFRADGTTPAENALVYVQVLQNDRSGSGGESALLSGLTDGSGYWRDAKTGGALNLAAVRTRDGAGYFSYSPNGDAVRIRVEGGSDCNGLIQVDTGNDAPAPDITLSCLAMMDLDITNGWDVLVLTAPPIGGADAEWLLDQISQQGGNGPELVRWLNNDWSSHLHNLPFGNFDLDANQPYFLHATTRSLVRVPSGIIPMQSNAITLTTGWNFVALPLLTDPLNAEAVCNQISAQGGAVREIARWDAAAGNWASHICGLPFGDFCLTPGRGYFIRAQANSTWSPQPGAQCRPTSAAIGVRQSPAAPAASSAVRITNVRDTSFTISWLTDQPATGQVRYGTGPTDLANTAGDDRGAQIVSHTHFVTLGGLAPETTYYAALVAGGEVYTMTTGPTLAIPAVHTIYGRVLQSDGVTPAAGSLVYITLADGDGHDSPGAAAALSAITDAAGYWALNLGGARTSGKDAYFAYGDGDTLSLAAWHEPIVQASQTISVSNAAPAPDLTLRRAGKVYLPLVIRP
jgi:hypothetical protein